MSTCRPRLLAALQVPTALQKPSLLQRLAKKALHPGKSTQPERRQIMHNLSGQASPCAASQQLTCSCPTHIVAAIQRLNRGRSRLSQCLGGERSVPASTASPGAPGVRTSRRTQPPPPWCLQVVPGQVLAFMGPSGSGKTSLLSVIGGRAPKRVEIEGAGGWRQVPPPGVPPPSAPVQHRAVHVARLHGCNIFPRSHLHRPLSTCPQRAPAALPPPLKASRLRRRLHSPLRLRCLPAVTVNGATITKGVRRHIGFVLQDDVLYEDLTGGTGLRLAWWLLAHPPRTVQADPAGCRLQ